MPKLAEKLAGAGVDKVAGDNEKTDGGTIVQEAVKKAVESGAEKLAKVVVQ